MNKIVKPITSSGMVYELVEIDEAGAPTGNKILFINPEFKGLQYNDLYHLKSTNPTLTIEIKNAQVLKSTLPLESHQNRIDINGIFISSYSCRTIGLVRDGWLPSGLSLSNDTIILPDRCTMTELVRFTKIENQPTKDFLDLFADREVRINPSLFALEGNLQKIPTLDVIRQQLCEAYEKVKQALPRARLVPEETQALQGIVGIIEESRATFIKEQEFLMDLAPRLKKQISAKLRPNLWNEILSTAFKHGIPKGSLIVLALLSAISVPNGKSPAKKLLKLTKLPYTLEHAYNALADLRSLKIFMSLLALFPNEHIMLCTSDRDLALFWVGIRASGLKWQGDDELQYKLSPVEELLPNLTPEEKLSLFDQPCSNL